MFYQICFSNLSLIHKLKAQHQESCKIATHHLQSCLILDTISFDRLFMCELENTNDIKQTHVVHQKRLKIIKLENVYLIYPIFWLKLFIHQNLKYKFSKVSTKTTSLFEGFKQKEIFFNVTLIINTFLSKSIKKLYTNSIYKAIMYQ